MKNQSAIWMAAYAYEQISKMGSHGGGELGKVGEPPVIGSIVYISKNGKSQIGYLGQHTNYPSQIGEPSHGDVGGVGDM